MRTSQRRASALPRLRPIAERRPVAMSTRRSAAVAPRCGSRRSTNVAVGLSCLPVRSAEVANSRASSAANGVALAPEVVLEATTCRMSAVASGSSSPHELEGVAQPLGGDAELVQRGEVAPRGGGRRPRRPGSRPRWSGASGCERARRCGGRQARKSRVVSSTPRSRAMNRVSRSESRVARVRRRASRSARQPPGAARDRLAAERSCSA